MCWLSLTAWIPCSPPYVWTPAGLRLCHPWAARPLPCGCGWLDDPVMSPSGLGPVSLLNCLLPWQCTCVAVSKKWLVLGTSAGGLHLIQRDGWKQRLILTHKEGFITQVACCPHDEDFIAVATSQGLLVVWELHLERRGRPERACVSWEHRGQAVTALCWDTAMLRVFAGDARGRVSSIRAGSSKLGKGSAFVIFPIQSITTVDSRVVQLGYQDGRLLVSSLSRCYLCDTEREKFWKVGNKERDGEYGACFFPQARGSAPGMPPLLYCARPGSRVWEASFSGEVQSTHQFKQLLACSPMPLISSRCEPQFNSTPRGPQSIAFPRLLCFSDQNLLTWTESAIYIFVPQCDQVLLWTEIKDVVEVATFRNELFCLHGDGRLSHLTLLSVERCVERLMRREAWSLAATVCCVFQHAIVPCRARKWLPIDRLEYLRSQLNPSTQQDLYSQLQDVIPKLEAQDSASSSRRSSISSHESFNVLDCGIYRVISRRGSQSDEDVSSLVSQSMLEEERLKEFSFVQEEEPVEPATADPLPSERMEPERSESGLQFHLPLSFRPKPPRVALQAVRDSVSSFVRKTSERINTLQMNSDLWPRPDQRNVGQNESTAEEAPFLEEMDGECDADRASSDADWQELRGATQKTIAQIQDPLVLLDPACLGEVLREWLSVLEQVLGPESIPGAGQWLHHIRHPEEEGPLSEPPGHELDVGDVKETDGGMALDKEGQLAGLESRLGLTVLRPNELTTAPQEPVRMAPPRPISPDLQANLTQLASLCLELSCFHGSACPEREEVTEYTGPCAFIRHYFFLLDPERTRRCCLLCYRDQRAVWKTYMAGLLELTRSDPVVEVIEKGVLLRSLKSLRDFQQWSSSSLLAHLQRLYEKHGEAAVRSFTQFYPKVIPSDVMAMAERSHFLAYLDNLVHLQAEEQRLSFLGSLLQPESLRQDWLDLALSHDAPQLADTLTSDGQPRWRSHLFTWGYGRLLSLLIQLPADFASKQKMAETCKTHGYWMGYLTLCCELRHRPQALATVCWLDDMSLLCETSGLMPETLDEWKLLVELSQNRLSEPDTDPSSTRDDGSSDSSCDWSTRVTTETLTLQLARVVGPDRALDALQSWGVHVDLGPQSTMVCELLRITEKRQRALIRTMLERCDRFLWSQQA